MIQEELETIRKTIGPEQYNAGEFKRASELFEHISTKNEYPEFLTLVAYDYID